MKRGWIEVRTVRPYQHIGFGVDRDSVMASALAGPVAKGDAPPMPSPDPFVTRYDVARYFALADKGVLQEGERTELVNGLIERAQLFPPRLL